VGLGLLVGLGVGCFVVGRSVNCGGGVGKGVGSTGGLVGLGVGPLVGDSVFRTGMVG